MVAPFSPGNVVRSDYSMLLALSKWILPMLLDAQLALASPLSCDDRASAILPPLACAPPASPREPEREQRPNPDCHSRDGEELAEGQRAQENATQHRIH